VLPRRSFSWLSKMRNQKLHLLSINWRCHPRGCGGEGAVVRKLLSPPSTSTARDHGAVESRTSGFSSRDALLLTNTFLMNTVPRPSTSLFGVFPRHPRTMTQFPIMRLYLAEIRCPFHSTETKDLPEVTTLLPRHRTTPPSVCDGVR